MKRIFLAFVLLAGISRLAYAGLDDGAIRIAAADRPDTQGKNYALIIGNNEYDNLPALKTAVNDATAIADVLQERYTFEQGAIKLLINATRREILKALSGFRKTLTSRDQLMLYYAGHGRIDPETHEGFWQPADAEPGNDFTWISNTDVGRYVRSMEAKHILVVADSAMSWGFIPGANIEIENQHKFIDKFDKNTSRTYISSGVIQAMANSGSGDLSVFTYYLVKALAENKRPTITSYQVYDRLVREVAKISNQTPEFRIIHYAGNQDFSDFTFKLRNGI